MSNSERNVSPGEVDAETRLKVLEQFVGALAHELRSPLTVIRNAAYILRRTSAATPDISECASLIEGEVNEMNQMIARLVELVRPSQLTIGAVSLKELLESAAEKADHDKRAKWQFLVEFDPPTLHCDRSRFFDVLHQIFSNAISATRGVGAITIRAIQDERSVTIDIDDDGPGIAPELRETLFDPFVSTRRSGMGLGLTYCREVLKRHGGDIHLQVSDRPGASFRLTIPRPPASN